jgi:hypothetical protein
MAGTAPARCRRTPQVRSNAFLGSHFYASETMIVLPRQARDKHIIVKVPGIKLELAFCLQASGTFRWGSAWSSRAGKKTHFQENAFSGTLFVILKMMHRFTKTGSGQTHQPKTTQTGDLKCVVFSSSCSDANEGIAKTFMNRVKEVSEKVSGAIVLF